MVSDRKSFFDRMHRFVAFYVLVPFIVSFVHLFLYLYFLFGDDYDSTQLGIGFLFYGFAGCVTKGLHWVAVSVGSRGAALLLGVIYLLTGVFMVFLSCEFASQTG